MLMLTPQMDENVYILHKRDFELKGCVQIDCIQQESTCQTLTIVEYSLKKKKKSGEKLILDRLDRLAQLALELSKLHATVTPRAYLTTLQFVVVTANTLLMSAAAVF